MVFRETHSFTRAVTNGLSKMPDAGSIIIGSGGIRKFKWATKGRGKRGGARVIYYWAAPVDTIVMLDVYAKSQKEDLSKREIRDLRQIVEGEYP